MRLDFKPHRSQVDYTLWVRRHGEKEWRHHGTPDASTAEENVPRWAVENPEWDYRLYRVTKVTERVTIHGKEQA